MPYDFDRIIERRGSACVKYARYRDREDVIPMWIADMDFESAPEIVAALHRRVDHGVFGYPCTPDALIDAAIGHMQNEFSWTVDPEWLVWLPGLVPGINLACRSCAAEGDDVLTATPAYPPFLAAPGNAGRNLVTVPMEMRDGRWVLDPDTFAASITPRTKLFLFCSPHNPTGRLFDRGEIEALARICLDHGVTICSDEIHNMLRLDDRPHLPTAALDPEIAARTVTLMAPSKTWNIAGLCCSYAVIPDAELRGRFQQEAAGVIPGVNLMGHAAALAAYEQGGPWLAACLDYLRGNHDLLEEAVAEMPGVSMTRVEATYLAWLDVRELELDDAAGFFEQAGVGLQDGAEFGAPGWLRLNFGCPRAVLREAVDRMAGALVRA